MASGADPSGPADGGPPVNRPNYRLLGAYGLMGLAFPTGASGVMLFRLVFIPRGRPMARFSTDHPAFIAAAILVTLGMAMFLTGFALRGDRD